MAKTTPGVGIRTKNFEDVEITEDMGPFGGSSEQSETSVAMLLSPKEKSKLQKKIDATIHPTRQPPLGKAGNPYVLIKDPGPPVPPETIFGDSTKRTGLESAKSCLTFDIDQDLERNTAELYITSHGSWGPGVQTNRKYNAKFSKMNRYGKATPNASEGVLVKKALNWLPDQLELKRTTLISKADREHKDRYGAALGAPTEPLRDTRAPEALDYQHTFGSTPIAQTETVATLFAGGMASPVEEEAGPASSGVGSLIETQDYYLGDHVDKKTVAAQALEDALVAKDIKMNGEATGLLLKEELTQVVIEFGIGLDLDQLPAVGHKVPYKHVLTKLVDGELSDHQHRDGPHGSGSPNAGQPTIRSDLENPTLKAVMDRRNFGEQGNAATVITPNRFTQRGITESDLNAPPHPSSR